MSETELLTADLLRIGKPKPCICCGSDFGGLLVMRESEELKEARLELAAAIESSHDLQALISRVAGLKAADDARHKQLIKAERDRLIEAIGSVPAFQVASLGEPRIV